MKYNPFAYIRSEKDILKLVQTIIANTKAMEKKQVKIFGAKPKIPITQLLSDTSSMKPQERRKELCNASDMIDVLQK